MLSWMKDKVVMSQLKTQSCSPLSMCFNGSVYCLLHCMQHACNNLSRTGSTQIFGVQLMARPGSSWLITQKEEKIKRRKRKMPKLMLVVSAELKNIAILQPQDGCDDETINYFFKLKCEYCGWISQKEACVSINVKEKPTENPRNDNPNLSRKCQGCERQGQISLIPGHGAPLSQNHCSEVDLMLFHCDGLLPMEYSFNGGWLATTTSGTEIHVDLTMGEFTNVIDGVEVSISELKAKFVPYWG